MRLGNSMSLIHEDRGSSLSLYARRTKHVNIYIYVFLDHRSSYSIGHSDYSLALNLPNQYESSVVTKINLHILHIAV